MLKTVNVYGKPWLMTLTPSGEDTRGTVLITIATISGRQPSQIAVDSLELVVAAKAIHKEVQRQRRKKRKLWPSHDWRWPCNSE